MFGAPIAASLLALDGLCGLAGWQWLFVVEGLPTIALGLYIARTLAPSPAQAAFLTPEEREWLCARNARVKARRAAPCLHSVSPASAASLSQGTQRGAGVLISFAACAHARLHGQPGHDAQRIPCDAWKQAASAAMAEFLHSDRAPQNVLPGGHLCRIMGLRNVVAAGA